MTLPRWATALFLALPIAACSSATGDSTFGNASSTPDGGASQGQGASGTPGTFGPASGEGGAGATGTGTGTSDGTLTATIRDFRLYAASDTTTNPDFENVPKTDASGNPDPSYTGPWDDHGIAGPTLGTDGKPVYAPSAGSLTTHGKAAFDQWFRDVPGTNVSVAFPIVLSPAASGAFEYDSEKTGVALSPSDPTKMFFPIDDGSAYATSFGDQGDPHDYSFTVELRTQFTYRGGEFFRFRGDDDVFVFIDGKRVIDLGGIHGPETAQVNTDDLGLVKGSSYPLDFFSAERHKTGSNILFTTTLGLRPAPLK